MTGPAISRAPISAACDGRSPLLDMAVDVFDDDDRVVDDKADRQHHRQQGQQIEAEPERRHDHPGADQRQRDRHDRDQHRPEAAEEQEDHHDDDAHAPEPSAGFTSLIEAWMNLVES